MAKIIPIENKVVIKQDAAAETIGSFIIPKNAQNPPKQGTVIAVGEEVVYLKAGDKVLFEQYIGVPVNIHDEQYVIMLEKNVYGRLED
jgi:co-chaperonin GroES (HSP10)